MTEQPEALRLADALDRGGYDAQMARNMDQAAAELRRLHAVNAELLEALRLTDIDCQHLHHAHKDRHELSADCPVVARITAAIAKAEKTRRAALNFVHQALQDEASISYVQSDAETYGLEEPKP